MAPEPLPENQRLRSFRIGAYAVYFAVVGLFCVLITVSVVRSVLAMTPDRPPSRGAVAILTSCLDDAEALSAA